MDSRPRPGWSGELFSAKIGSFAFIVMLGGIGLRIAGWLSGRNLWLDEVRLAANILDRSWSNLIGVLDFSQSAPVLFLFSVKACVAVFGLSEPVFRLVPLLASVAQLVIFWRLSCRVLSPVAALVAVAFGAFSTRLLYFSQELKQYGTESLVATLLIYLALRWFDEPQNKRATWLLAGCGAVGILFSHTTVFIFAGVVGAAVALPSVQRARIFTPPNILLFGVCWIPLFLINYRWVIAGNYQDEVMINFWANTYPGVPFDRGGLVRWAGLVSGAIRYHELPLRTIQLLVVLGLPGLLWLVRKRDPRLLIVLLPVVLYWTAGMVHRAPFYGRLLVFLHPAVILGAALALQESCRLSAGWRLGRAVPVGCLLLALFALGKQFDALPKPTERNLAVEALARVKREASPGDVVYVSSYAVSTHRVYAKFDPYPPGLVVIEGRRKVTWHPVPFAPATASIDRDTFVADLKQINPGSHRVWLVLNRFRELRKELPEDLKAIWGNDRVSLVSQQEYTDLYLVERADAVRPPDGA